MLLLAKCKVHPENPIWRDDVDIVVNLTSDKLSFRKTGYKHYFGLKDNEKIICLHVTLNIYIS